MNNTVYLDNAATSYPKPACVYKEAVRCMKYYCGNPGRSSHKMSLLAAEKIYECRSLLSEFINSNSPEKVVFTLNTTYALNIAIKAVIKHGDHVITGNAEHNSVLRPLYELKKTHGISISKINVFADGDEIVSKMSSLITPRTRAVVFSHAGNVIPYVLPIEKIGALCRRYGIFFILDCAQSAGVYDIDMKGSCIDAVCLPSHKGLLGIQGAGAVCFSDSAVSAFLKTFIEGGNGTLSFDTSMPDFLPERFEAGTLPTPAIASLCEGVKYVNGIGLNNIRQMNKALCSELCARLSSLKNVVVYNGERLGSTVVFNVSGLSSEDVASSLSDKGICVRGGFHCCPDVHRFLSTENTGAVRASFSIFNTKNDIDALYTAVRSISENI